jgi:uncharacterized protein (TIGR02266 family)
MQTVLLADDERVFKALEGTCLRRETCKLKKASLETLSTVAVSEPPDLIVLALTSPDSVQRLRDLRANEALSRVPIIALDFLGKSSARRTFPRVTLLPLKNGKAQDDRLDEAIKKHLPLMRRRVDRVGVSVPVKCRGEGFSFTVRTKNISPSGLFLKTSRELSPGDRIRVKFALPESEPIAATCQVVRRVGPGGNDDDDLIPGIGVRFIELEENGRSALLSFVSTGAWQTASRPARRARATH